MWPDKHTRCGLRNRSELETVTDWLSAVTTYVYDAANRRTAITYPSTHQVTYGYTTRGELQTV